MAILASRQPHCLYDLLTRWRTGELRADVRVVIANHPDHAEVCAFHGVPYEYLPVDAGHKADQEAAVLDVLAGHDVDLVVLARYMQILSPAVIDRYRHRIINIHHSFLPAFIGADPYRQAHDRGVKLIGATAHYATEDLDEGPIIDQEVVRVSHRDDVAALAAKGRDLETVVLARAVRAHLDHRDPRLRPQDGRVRIIGAPLAGTLLAPSSPPPLRFGGSPSSRRDADPTRGGPLRRLPGGHGGRGSRRTVAEVHSGAGRL